MESPLNLFKYVPYHYPCFDFSKKDVPLQMLLTYIKKKQSLLKYAETVHEI
jgi:hypothetical protein